MSENEYGYLQATQCTEVLIGCPKANLVNRRDLTAIDLLLQFGMAEFANSFSATINKDVLGQIR